MRHRSVIEVMVLTFTFVVAVFLLMISTAIVIVEIRDPETDTSGVTQALLSLISGILGALLGLIAGRSVASSSLDERQDD